MAREEEEEEAMFLTYDRPEIVNKVVFRRRPSTGTWEVCPPNEVSQLNKTTSSSAHASTRKKQPQQRVRNHKQLSAKTPSHIDGELEVDICGLPVQIALQKAASSGLPSIGRLAETRRNVATSPAVRVSHNDPDYTPGTTPKRPKGRGRGSDSRNKRAIVGTPHKDSRSPAVVPTSLTNSFHSPPNHVTSDSISSRTRHKQPQSSPPDDRLSKLSSSPHRYPIRHKL